MEIERWGHIPYSKAHERQKRYVGEIAAGHRIETVVLCSHPPVVTLGKQSTDEDLAGWSGETHSVERGGKATYHGPGQIVCYPMIKLDNRGCGIGEYLAALERAVIETLAHYGVKSFGNKERKNPALTGVWEERSGKKLASIGVAVKRWVTSHGLALNLDLDPLAFQGIRPCGYEANAMTSLEAVIQKKIDRGICERHLLDSLFPLLQQKEQA
ncbi:MAG: lipoyl(octanoyl) transferase LipB [Bacteriovoracales bacterium]|nr:lipoyl(octanoyl) transferase LipB [Bacteriovoracales bacterium]